MAISSNIERLVEQLSQAIPESLKLTEQEAKQKIHQLLQAGLRELHLVSREEFDVQAKVLARTRAKLDELSQKVSELEQKNSSAK